jgi:p-aminobenzoyl-glutamate transporter AbgT
LISRQKIVGWLLIVMSLAYLVYFWKAKLLGTGPALEKADWLRAVGCLVLLVIGTINIRLAAMREKSRNVRSQTESR